MKTLQLGRSALQVTRIALGCMRLSDDLSEARDTIYAALEAGITFFDHADIYGGGRRETIFGQVLKEQPGLRDRMVLQSKCGIRFAGEPNAHSPKRFDFSFEHIVASVEGSLERLGTDHLDVLLLHRPDPLIEPEEVGRAFGALHDQGKVRFFGVSNHTAAQMQLLQAHVDQPLVANQLQFSLVHTGMLDEGIIVNRSDYPAPSRNEGTLEHCRLNDVTVQAWSPLAGGSVTGRPLESPDPRVQATSDLVGQMANERGVSREAIAVAWLLRHPARIQPIIGTTNPERIAACCQADGLDLTRDEWYSLYIAGRGRELP